MARTRQGVSEESLETPRSRRVSKYIKKEDLDEPLETPRTRRISTAARPTTTQGRLVDENLRTRRVSTANQPPVRRSRSTKPDRIDTTKRDRNYRGYKDAAILVAIVSAILLFFLSASPRHNPKAPIIVVLGATGAGKSSFIKALGGRSAFGRHPVVGHGLESKTHSITPYYATVNKKSVQLYDTPGFDDTVLSDAEIWEELAFKLARMIEDKRWPHGLVYLYDVSAPRMGREAEKTLRLFETFVGERAFKNVVLASTHFDPTDPQHASRQTELRNSNRYWSGMADHGANVTIHNGTAKSAADIILHLLDAQPIYRLDVVYELAEKQLPWDKTDVAEALNEDYMAAVARLEEEMRNEKERLEGGGDEGWVEAGERRVERMGRKVERGYEYLKRGTSRRFEVVREYVEM